MQGNLQPNLVPRLFLRGRKDPGRSWSRDADKIDCLRGYGQSVELLMLPLDIVFLRFAMLDCIVFLSCLEFAVLNSLYQETILKPKQVSCLESVYLGKDVICVLPTGYGKSLIFHLLPMLLFAKFNLCGNLLSQWRSKGFCTATVESIVIVVSPLNSLMSD